MTYRDDVDAAKLRSAALSRELRETKEKIAELEPLAEHAKKLSSALESTERLLADARTKVPLPLLGRVKVASPCHEKWSSMSGDDHVRHCGKCDKDVYDLSSLTAHEAESLLRARGQSLCVRFYRRADGTVLTADCPVGVRRKRVRLVAAAAATAVLAGAGAAAAALGLGGGDEGGCRVGNPVMWGPEPMPMMGAIAVDPVPPDDVEPMMGEPMIDDFIPQAE